jgi:outer membrane protein assembly factor BamB
VVVLRDGALLHTFPTSAQDLDVSSDGQWFVVASGHQIKLYSTDGGLVWIYHTDSQAVSPRFSPDGSRLCIATALGTIDILDIRGKLLWERDMTAKVVPAWLEDGKLLMGSSNGWVTLLDAGYRQIWSTRLVPTPEDAFEAQFPSINIQTIRP